MSKLIKIDPKNPEEKKLKIGAEAIEKDKLVIYPTETVYGIGANACSNEAVGKIFKAKSRPLENPISIAIDSMSMAYRVGKLTAREETLIQEFLPGPLTILVKKRPILSNLLTGGTDKVGIRIPDHPVALGLIRKVGRPITSTSANITGKETPEKARGCLDQLGESIDLAFESGKIKSGTPSTVLDVTEGVEIIRPGPITESQIRSVI